MKSALAPNRFLIVIPCYNCENYIAECLESLRAQTFQNWNALVADDASEDGTEQAVRPFLSDKRIRYRRLPHRNWLMGNTLHALRSLDLKPSDVVAILDGDDWIRPDCLQALWEKHLDGYDLVYTDEDIEGQSHSVGRRLLRSVPVRKQLWCISQLRSFKGYLFSLLNDDHFRDGEGRYYRAAGDLSLYLPMAELAGPEKIFFIEDRLYYYRVHEDCNFKVLRGEQLDNNRRIRSGTPLLRQTNFFDFEEEIQNLDKAGLFDIAVEYRKKYPIPYSVRIRHRIDAGLEDSWRAYHGLWIENGVFLEGVIKR